MAGEIPDVVVIGAGAAGLSAARELARHDIRVLVLEARPAIGGRIDTVHDSSWPLAIERGAEFLHDEAPVTTALAESSGSLLETVPDTHYWLEHGQARRVADMDEALQNLLKKTRLRGPDRSLAAALSDAPPTPAVETARFYVEGYHAADLDRVSAASLREDGAGDGDAPTQRRAPGGYDRILESIVRALPSDRVTIRTDTVVRRLRWRRGEVRLSTEAGARRTSEIVAARACVVTAPIGVLRAGSIRFEPEPAGWSDALERLDMGPVEKLVLCFREPFWNDRALWRRLARRSTPPAFWHARDVPFPTFWTSAPHHDRAVLTAWAGGPAARALRSVKAGIEPSLGTLIERAIDSLAAMLPISRNAIDDQLFAAAHHAWQDDPFSGGAYSYMGVGGRSAQQWLAQPVDGTLILAGEAFDESTGTVEGALASGRNAARRLRRSWGRSTRGSSDARRSTTSGERRSGTSPPR
jgi:monoamine oxidase